MVKKAMVSSAVDVPWMKFEHLATSLSRFTTDVVAGQKSFFTPEKASGGDLVQTDRYFREHKAIRDRCITTSFPRSTFLTPRFVIMSYVRIACFLPLWFCVMWNWFETIFESKQNNFINIANKGKWNT